MESASANVDDRDPGAGLHNALKKRFHDDLCPAAVERANQRQRQDLVPELDNRSGQFHEFLLLATNDGVAAVLVDLHGIETELIQEHREVP